MTSQDGMGYSSVGLTSSGPGNGDGDSDGYRDDHEELSPWSKAGQFERIKRPHFMSQLSAGFEKLNAAAREWWSGSARHRMGLAIVVISTATAISLSAVLFSTALSRPSPPLPRCGGSVEEAQEFGCVFDVMANAWIPRECYFEDVARDFLSLPNTTWYADEQHRELVPLEEFKKGEMLSVFPAADHHDRHCLYTWRKLQFAITEHLMIDTDSVSGKHVKHCTDYLVGRYPDVKPVMSIRAFLRCVYI